MMPLDIHQKLVLIAIGLLLMVMIVENFYPEVWKQWWWHPISIKNKLGQEIYFPATPTLIAFALLLIALCVREE